MSLVEFLFYCFWALYIFIDSEISSVDRTGIHKMVRKPAQLSENITKPINLTTDKYPNNSNLGNFIQLAFFVYLPYARHHEILSRRIMNKAEILSYEVNDLNFQPSLFINCVYGQGYHSLFTFSLCWLKINVHMILV